MKKIKQLYQNHRIARAIAKGVTAYVLLQSPDAIAEDMFFNQPQVQAVEDSLKQQEPSISFGLKADHISGYLFRGILNSNGPVNQYETFASLDHSDLGAFTAIGFTNIENGVLNEVDGILEHSKEYELPAPFNNALVSVGFAYLTFPNTDLPDTQEIYANAEFGSIFPEKLHIVPNIGAVSDIGNVGGTYATAGLTGNFEIGELISAKSDELTATLSVEAAYDHKHIWDKSGFSNVKFGAEVALKCGDNIILKPHFDYSLPLDEDLEDIVVGGVSAEIGF